jgi:hypothetical protein
MYRHFFSYHYLLHNTAQHLPVIYTVLCIIGNPEVIQSMWEEVCGLHYASLYRGLEYPWILVSTDGRHKSKILLMDQKAVVHGLIPIPTLYFLDP